MPDELNKASLLVDGGDDRAVATTASLLLLALAVPVLCHAFLLDGEGGPLPLRLDDDAFYYLTIARNIVAGEGVTFDDLAPTNGFHPLWLTILLPVAAAAASDDWLVAVVYLLDMGLWAIAVLLLADIGRRLMVLRHMVLVFPVLVWYGATWGGRGHHMFFVGLEIGLAIVLILGFLRQALRHDLYGRRVRDGALLRIGGLLGLLLLARLDAVFLAATAGLAFVATARRRGEPWSETARQSLLLGGPIVAAALLYVCLNLWIAGTPLAVSGQAKSLGGPWFADATMGIILLQGFLPKMPLLSGVPLLLGATLGLAFVSRKPLPSTPASWPVLATAVLTAIPVQWLAWWAAYIPDMARAYYFYLTPVALLLILPRLVSMIETALAVPPALTRWTGLAATGCMIALLAVYVARPPDADRNAPDRLSFLDHSRLLALWLKANTPADSLYAMGDRAGVVGYILHRPVFQLEGLVNSAGYLEDLAATRVDNRYLIERGIDYLILSELTRTGFDAEGCAIVPHLADARPAARLRVCAEDRLYEERMADGWATVWRLRPR